MAQAQAPPAVEPTTVNVEVTPRQLAMIQHPATVLWIGTGTKTGKTTALALWLAEGILEGEPVAWCGSNSTKTREAYELTKRVLGYAHQVGEVTWNDTSARIESRRGGLFVPFTGENPDAIYGGSPGAYKRFVIDEASRQDEDSFVAALTTITPVKGQIRCAFNLDKGGKNWAIRNLLRVQAMSEDERNKQAEDFMIFPTGDAPFVDPGFIELMRKKMPAGMFDALFLAKIPEADVSLFRNLDRVFRDRPTTGPLANHSYVQAVDLARKQDWTVALVGDVTTGQLVDLRRFHEISWSLQYEKIRAQYKEWKCSASLVDQTGLGDVVVPELEARGMRVEGVVIVPGSKSDRTRRALIEGLVVACDNMDISAPEVSTGEGWRVLRAELDSFEFVLDERGNVTYEVPSNMNDDTVIAAALFVKALKDGSLGPVRFEPGPALAVTLDSLRGFG